MTLFGMHNQTNTEIARELIKSVLCNLVEGVASCPSHTWFGEYLYRKSTLWFRTRSFLYGIQVSQSLFLLYIYVLLYSWFVPCQDFQS